MKRNLRLSRREFLRTGTISATALLLGSYTLQRAEGSCRSQNNLFRGGTKLGVVAFGDEGLIPLDTPLGTELDGRLYTDLSRISEGNAVTPSAAFYVRTRASRLLPRTESWRVAVDGLVERASSFTITELNEQTRPLGTHLMECAGNPRMASFGMISVATWRGVPISEILDKVKIKAQATRVLIAGFDHYATQSASSIPGASWVFTPEQLNTAGAMLATGMNHQALTKDHGAPVRLLVPGWYGCACIKWVNHIQLVDDTAEATSQMQEYATRTFQDGVPRLAKEYKAALIDPAAMPVRVEKWRVAGKIKYRIVGILWGGSQTIKELQICISPDGRCVPVDSFCQTKPDCWTIWSHAWSPPKPGVYAIRLAVKSPPVQARKLDSGYYVRSVSIAEV